MWNFLKNTINPPYNSRDMVVIFLTLVILLVLPLIIIGTLGRQNLSSQAIPPNCEREIKDSETPFVSIVSPRSGAYLSSQTNIEIKAADNNNCVKKISLLIDDKRVKVFLVEPFKYVWNTALVQAGNHTITAIAEDYSGNQSKSIITVYKGVKKINLD